MVGINDMKSSKNVEEIPHDHLYIVTGLSSGNLQKMAADAPPLPADFEAAIAATGFGKFNVIFLICTLPAFWSSVSVTSAVSYIFTRAKCDMKLSLLDMGTVSAITYGDLTINKKASYLIGMISSAMLWGFLSDTLGRKKIMVGGFFATGLLELLAGVSQNFPMMLVTRFLCGFLFNGPFAVLLSYMAELHRTELRSRVILLSSLFYTIANSTLPLLAWAFLTRDIDIYIYGDAFVIHSWNLFLLVTALVPLLTGLAFIYMPESPKFLMSRGRNEEAMVVFQKIYAMNTGRSMKEYPIKCLIEEKPNEMARGFTALRGGFRQLAPLFKPPHGPWLLFMCAIHSGCMFGSNTLRLWFPQLAAMIGAASQESLCSAITTSTPVPVLAEELELCEPLKTDMSTYLQSVIVGAGSFLTYGIGGIIVNKCGKKLVAGACAISGAILTLMLPFLGSSSTSVVAMITGALAFTSLSGASMSGIVVDLFPTSLRVMALAIFLMCGRLGTISGTVAFPALIDFGCVPPFITIAAVLTAIGLGCFIVPNTTLKKLE